MADMELDMVADMEVDKVAGGKNGRHGVGHGGQHGGRQVADMVPKLFDAKCTFQVLYIFEMCIVR